MDYNALNDDKAVTVATRFSHCKSMSVVWVLSKFTRALASSFGSLYEQNVTWSIDSYGS